MRYCAAPFLTVHPPFANCGSRPKLEINDLGQNCTVQCLPDAGFVVPDAHWKLIASAEIAGSSAQNIWELLHPTYIGN